MINLKEVIKMQSLKEIIDNVIRKVELWTYWGYIPNGDIYNKEECRLFIKKYMECAGTLSEFNVYTSILDDAKYYAIDSNRYQHIVFTFFIGLAIYDNCKIIRGAIDQVFCESNEYESALELHKDKPFSYLWFLICLFHNLGYQYECTKNAEKQKVDTFQNIVSHVTKDGIPSLLTKIKGVPKYFTPKLIENYYNYRKYSMGKYDHGICGAMNMFETLCNIRRGRKKDMHPGDKSGKWKDELEDIFALAASIVLCHNIFLPSKKSCDDYKKYQLEELIGLAGAEKDMQYPFKMEDFPIFFLFCLVDTIEPIKVIKDPQLLNNIFCEFDNNSSSIKLSTNLVCGCADRILGNLRELKDWLCDIDFINANTVRIKLMS